MKLSESLILWFLKWKMSQHFPIFPGSATSQERLDQEFKAGYLFFFFSPCNSLAIDAEEYFSFCIG